jgi:rhodanese-related sulfurtransferase
MSYAGDATCQETWETLKSDAKACLVDVRTTREWKTIGAPDLSSLGKDVVFVEWQMFPDMRLNPDFADHVEAALKAANVGSNDPVYFLCRSGVRSQGAASALSALGYSKCYNILGGFEGNPDVLGQRGKINGWQFDQLPVQKE